jgi:hypothetical protein
MNESKTLRRYLVTLNTPHGQGEIEVPSFLGADAAGRRAAISACAIGWGDLDTVTVASVVDITEDES